MAAVPYAISAIIRLHIHTSCQKILYQVIIVRKLAILEIFMCQALGIHQWLGYMIQKYLKG